jgi:flagellar motor switch/type III secretory pathway protein FliN
MTLPKLPKLHADEARWCQRLALARAAWADALASWASQGPEPYSTRLTHARARRLAGLEHAPLDAAWLLQASWDDAPLLLALDLSLALAAIDAHLGRPPELGRASRPLSGWEGGFVAARVAAWLDGLAEVGGPRLRASLTPAPASALKAWAKAPLLELELEVALDLAGRSLGGALRAWGAPEALERAWATRSPPSTPAARVGRWALAHPGLVLDAQLGWTLQVAPDHLYQLAPQALLVASALQHPPQVIAGGATLAPLRREGPWSHARFVVSHPGEVAMSSPDALSRALAQAHVEVVVELARQPMTLGALAALSEGQVLPLVQARPGEATLRAGDQILARGELVEVEGALALRVVSVGGT